MGISYAQSPKEKEQLIDETALYLVDFTKLNSVNDLVLILSAMGISFGATHPHFEVVKAFLNLDNPIHMNTMPQEQEFHPAGKKEIELPKLKSLK